MSPRRDDRYDVITDSLAMVKAAHDDDAAAFTFLLGAADLKSCCEFLAELGSDLIAQLAREFGAEPAEFIQRVRARQLGEPGPSRDWLRRWISPPASVLG